MIHELNSSVWWGDKPSVVDSIGKFRSIINVAHSIREPYWSDLRKLHWETWYFRLASPDREHLKPGYCSAFVDVVQAIRRARKFPILCHCRMGGHRGPSAAIFAACVLGANVDQAIARVCEVQPKFADPNPHRVYRDEVLSFIRGAFPQ